MKKITIKEIIKLQEPEFKGICVNDAQNNNLVRQIGVTLGWKLTKKPSSILIAGNDFIKSNHPTSCCEGLIKEKGKYFIAEVVKIVNLHSFALKTGGSFDSQIREHHCCWEIPLQYNSRDEIFYDKKYGELGKDRYVIYFQNPTEIRYFDEAFSFFRRPEIYI